MQTSSYKSLRRALAGQAGAKFEGDVLTKLQVIPELIRAGEHGMTDVALFIASHDGGKIPDNSLLSGSATEKTYAVQKLVAESLLPLDVKTLLLSWATKIDGYGGYILACGKRNDVVLLS